MAEKPMDKLRREISALGGMAERSVDSAVLALIDRNQALAAEVIDYDAEVDEMELAASRRCLEVLQLARVEPEGFRFAIAALQIGGHLEHISDLAVDIAEHVVELVKQRSLQMDLDHVAEMLEFTEMMVRDSVNSLVDRDFELAWRVCAHDDIVDEAYQALEAELYDIIAKKTRRAVSATHMLLCALDLEQIADLAVGIAEEVIYILEGKIVRHHIEEWKERLAPELDKHRRRSKWRQRRKEL